MVVRAVLVAMLVLAGACESGAGANADGGGPGGGADAVAAADGGGGLDGSALPADAVGPGDTGSAADVRALRDAAPDAPAPLDDTAAPRPDVPAPPDDAVAPPDDTGAPPPDVPAPPSDVPDAPDDAAGPADVPPPPDCPAEGCPGFTYCDEATGTCVLGCDRRAQCVAYADCDLATHTCICDAGYHDCDGACVSDDDPAHCGDRCTPCPGDPDGVATCSGTQCGLLCDSGAHLCGGECVADDDPAHCGTSCDPCPAIAHGHATCDGTACGAACDPGYHRCDGACVADEAVAHCGDRCWPCPSVANGSPYCTPWGTCSFICDPDHHTCDDACVADDSTAHCGLSCDPCPTVAHGAATCDGVACGFTCDPGYHTCAGACVDSAATDHCGDRCAPCPDDPNGTTVCVDGACGLDCADGHRLCDGGCAPCPAAAGATGLACAGAACVITGCEDGHHPVGDACAPWENEAFIDTGVSSGDIGVTFAADGDHAHVCFGARLGMYGSVSCRYWSQANGYRTATVARNLTTTYPYLAVADSTYPRVAYTHYEQGEYRPRYSTLSPYTEGVSDYEIGPDGSGSDYAVAIDAADLAHVTYVIGGTLYHAWQEASLGPFTVAVVDDTGYNSDTAVAVIPSGEVVVAYVCDGGLVCLHRSGPDGSPDGGAVVPVDDGDIIATATAIAVDAAGTILVAYYDAQGRDLWLARSRPDGGWDREVVRDGGGGAPSLALDPHGRPCLADLSSAQEVRFAQWDGAAWRYSTVDADSEAREPRLRFDAAGAAHVVYRVDQWVYQRSLALD